jgi:peptidoglycan/xylan/chitin deacetylase (PgdA/CDA1 family)
LVGEDLCKPGAREIAEQAKAAGHWLGNHTMTHGAPLGTSEDSSRVEREIGATQKLLGELSHPHKWFRPNGEGRLGPHLLSRAAVDFLVAGRYSVVTWNNVPGDWIEPRGHWVERALATMRTQEWSVVVLHDFLLGPMIETLPRFLDEVAACSVEIVQEFPEQCTLIAQGQVTEAFTVVCGAT